MTDPAILRPTSDRTHRTPMQWRAEGNLAQHPYQLELRGSPGSLTWPSICAYCGEGASGHVRAPKVFLRPRTHGRRNYSTPFRRTIITKVDIPFCASCIERHEATVQRPSLASKVLRTLLTPMLIPMFGSLFFGQLTLRIALDMKPGDQGPWVPWGLTGLFAFGFLWSLAGAWGATRSSRIEKQTEVTKACDFSDDISDMFGGERHIYTVRDRGFAESLAALNPDRIWTDEDDRKVSRRWGFIAGALLLVGAIIWIIVVLGPGP